MNYIANRNFTTVDKNGIHYAGDTAQATTTLHCNLSDGKWRRQAVIARTIPVEARAQWHAQSRANRALEHTEDTRKYDAYITAAGNWAINAKVDKYGTVCKCDGYSETAPVRTFGKYGMYGSTLVFSSPALLLGYRVATR